MDAFIKSVCSKKIKQYAAYPNGTLLGYVYSARKQVKTITSNQSLVTSYQYDKAGNRLTKSLTPNDITQVATYQYDSANRLENIVHSSNNEIFDSLNYTYNTVNNITSRKQKAVFWNVADYQYDKTDQLKQAFYNEGKRVVDYQWDKVGNRIQVNDNWLNQPTTYQANNLNQYTSINQQAPSYDANGNLTKAISDQPSTFSYDSDNKLLTAQKGNVSLTVNYDAGRRAVSRTINGEITYLIYDGWNLIAEYNAKGQISASYVHGANIDELISKTQNGDTVYYHQDVLGNVIHLTSAKGQIVEGYQYDAFGEPTIFKANGQQLNASAWNNRFLFTGREWIKELGLYDYRNRVYSPELGRFLTTDPIRFGLDEFNYDSSDETEDPTEGLIDPKTLSNCNEGGIYFALEDINLYRYVKNNPINATDPEGLMGPGTIIAGAAVGVSVVIFIDTIIDRYKCRKAVQNFRKKCNEKTKQKQKECKQKKKNFTPSTESFSCGSASWSGPCGGSCNGK